ncbi:hypothetical protein L1887_40092 [Cichorium endivia]|nr:hypothetical protein L1887_40092 [Cichorium endivia]
MSQSQSNSPSSRYSNNIDCSNHFYLGSSDNPGSILLSNVFNGVGFMAWKRAKTIALAAKNKYGFVDGTITQPSKNIADTVLFLQSTREIWKELDQRYAQSDGALIYQIQQQLYSVSQSSDNFSTYFTKLSKIWDELRIVQDLLDCSCGAAA